MADNQQQQPAQPPAQQQQQQQQQQPMDKQEQQVLLLLQEDGRSYSDSRSWSEALLAVSHGLGKYKQYLLKVAAPHMSSILRRSPHAGILGRVECTTCSSCCTCDSTVFGKFHRNCCVAYHVAAAVATRVAHGTFCSRCVPSNQQQAVVATTPLALTATTAAGAMPLQMRNSWWQHCRFPQLPNFVFVWSSNSPDVNSSYSPFVMANSWQPTPWLQLWAPTLQACWRLAVGSCCSSQCKLRWGCAQ